ncbi:uncharacterized protein [Miscanthus floridulus]|uniref:uncharacterized protein n=1 Tax=Miscanthus floridulus TaxID=154761 RepID=UPI0034596721
MAAQVLWKSLLSVLSSANHEVRSGFELRVAALLADIAAASAARRAAIVSAGGGAVLDWLLESVVRGATQAEGARALAHLVADPWVTPAALGRPYGVPCLLQFIFSYQPMRGKKLFHFHGQRGTVSVKLCLPALVYSFQCLNLNFQFLQLFVTTELATDIVFTIGDVKFYLHKC